MLRALTLAFTLCLLAASIAWADETIRAIPPNQFASATTTIDQGEKVTLQNSDIAGHDVTAKTKSADGKPVFQSELIAPGASGPVPGTEYLTTGTYPFVCSVHPGMEATLEVTSAGTPAKKPDPPAVGVKIKSGDLQKVVKRGKLSVSVTSTKATVKLSGTVRAGKTFRLGRATVEFGSKGTKSVTLKLSKKVRNALKGKKRAKFSVTAAATDEAGQVTKATASRTLR